MRLTRLFFPPNSRDFTGSRWLKIALRTIHLVGIAGVFGGVLFRAPAPSWQIYLQLTLFSGFAFVILELWSNGVFLIQIRGLAIFIKLGLLYYFTLDPARVNILLLVIILSSIISHAPGDVRYYSLWHRRRMEALKLD